MTTLKQSTTYTRMFLLVQSSDHVTGLTGATASVSLSKAGGSFAAAGGTVTEVANGWYKIALTTTDTNTLGDLAYHITATSADPTDFVDQVTGNILGDTLPASLSGTQTFNMTGNITGNLSGSVGSVTTAISLPSIPSNWITASGIAASALNGKGDWNVGKTGYSLTQTFPTNFASLAITVGGAVTAGTVGDKTGYSLSQTFPANFADLAITATTGQVTVGTNNDKTGYTASTVSDKTGYSLTSAYDPAKTAAQAGDAMTLTVAYDAAKSAAPVGAQMDLVGTPNATAVTAIQSGLATSSGLTTLQAHGDASWATATGFAIAGDAMTLTAAYDFAKGTVAMAESYAANGTAPTPTQALMAIHQDKFSFAIAGTAKTVKKLDNSTPAYVVTLNSATTPTGATRS